MDQHAKGTAVRGMAYGEDQEWAPMMQIRQGRAPTPGCPKSNRERVMLSPLLRSPLLRVLGTAAQASQDVPHQLANTYTHALQTQRAQARLAFKDQVLI